MFRHVNYDGMLDVIVALGGVSVLQLEDIPGEFDHRRLEAQADAEERFPVEATPTASFDLALDAALAKTSRNYDTTKTEAYNQLTAKSVKIMFHYLNQVRMYLKVQYRETHHNQTIGGIKGVNLK